MNNLNLDIYLDVANQEKKNRGLDDYIPLYPMLRIQDDKLYVGLMLTSIEDNVWSNDANIKPEYWLLIDVNNNEVIEFNKTDDKDFVNGDIVSKDADSKQQEISKYTVKKTLEYKEYFMNDIKNEEIPIQKKVSSIIGNNIYIDGDLVDLKDFLLANFEEEINEKIDSLIETLVKSKYSSITYYYDALFSQIIKTYKDNNVIEKDMLKLCVDIMNNYYDGVIGIDNFFNI